MHGAIDGDRRPRRQIHRAAVAFLVRRHRGQGAERVGGIIRAGEHGMDAGHLSRRARIDAADVGMRVRRTHDGRIKLIGEFQIVEIAAEPAQQARILAPQHRLSDGKFAHDLTVPCPPMISPNLEPALLWARRGAKARPRTRGQRGDMRRLIFLALLLILGAGGAFADDYPSQPIRLIVPFAAGGAVDAVARVLAHAARREPRPADRDRQPRRRRRHHRHGRGRESRRPTATRCCSMHSGLTYMPGLYRKLPFDPVEGFRRHHHRGLRQLRAGGEQRSAVQVGRRADRLRQGQSRQADLRLGRDRLDAASGRRVLQARRRHRHRARALQGRGAGDDRPRRRPGPDDVRPAGRDPAARRRPARSARWR